MIDSLGGFRQLGMVVRDVDATMRYMTEKLGIGPFYVVRKITPEDYSYRGERTTAPVMTLCFAQTGPLQIELIQQHNDAPSAYTEFLGAGREGCQHITLWFADRPSYMQTRERLINSGLTLVHENGPRATAQFAYFATDIPGGLMLELAEALLPNVRGLFDLVAAESKNWDGSNPIREVG
jgi:hypothetical protein